MKKGFLLALVFSASLLGACGDKKPDYDLTQYLNDDGSFGTYDGSEGEAGDDGSNGDNGDNFWASDASDSAGNFDANGDGYVCVDGECY